MLLHRGIYAEVAVPLKGGALPAVSARKDGVATPPQRQHSAQAVAQARAENGGAASGIADGSPVRSA